MNDHDHQSQSTVALLQRIYGPVHAIVLGPVTSMQQGPLSTIACESVTILDPDSRRVTNWHESNSNNKEVCVLNRGLADKAGTVPYFEANIPYESGTTRPESLKCLWQNVETVEEGQLQVSTIEDIALETGRKFNWVISEAINGVDTLEALGQHAEQIEVVIARTINDSAAAKELPELSKPRLDSLAKSLGMLEVACLPNRHPKTATAIYVRHWKSIHDAHKEGLEAQLSQVDQALDEKSIAEKKLKIAENNLDNLREKHKALSDENLEQSRRLSEIKAHLAAAMTELKKPRRSTTTRTARTKTKSSVSQQSSKASE